EVRDGAPQRVSIPPTVALQFREAGEEIDYAHVNLHETNGKVGAGARRGWRQASLAGPASHKQAIERIGIARGAEHQIHGQHDIDLIESEQRLWHTVYIRN